MSATQFHVDMRDIRFVMFEQLDLVARMGTVEPFAEYDRDLYEAILGAAEQLAVNVLGPLNSSADRAGCDFDGAGNVKTPKGFASAWGHLVEGGWLSLGAPAEWDGTPMPHVVSVAVHEMFTGACVSFATYPGLARGTARLVDKFGPEWLRQAAMPKMYGGHWAGTMCLTEAHAGTSVGDGRTKAIPQEDGTYHVIGEKIFITAGDQEFTENIVHIVLARVPGATPGIKGLSLFAVPKFEIGADGSLGPRNGAMVTGIEEKMGLHGSATCTLTFGASQPAIGYRLGEEGGGIKMMFHLMNEARIGVGIQGLSSAAVSYLNSLAYAKERVQGTHINNIRDANAPRVPIVVHPDVRRMLMLQKVSVETIRSLLYSTALAADRAHHALTGAEEEAALGQVELVTPLCKAHCSDVAFDAVALAFQVFGGCGYTAEYPVEQHLRDSKITSVYEGTNGVQAMDLLGRKMRLRGGAVLMEWMANLDQELGRCRELGCLDDEVAAMTKAKGAFSNCAMHVGALGMSGELETAFLHASPFLTLFGTLALGKEAMIQARVAHTRLQDEPGQADRRFYEGKILNARFYCAHVLPQVYALEQSIRSGDTSCMDAALFAP